ncbi:MAG: sugar phosphate isomerase/epimerase [Verrucomicrobia bacterium]|nr:sugar phosphate isomerase/epimerase [Verrucomicrobiota bacterium]MDA1007277.1 sugar phosphate isomerase/epimerase [Verrucomicrobiota bacterium]
MKSILLALALTAALHATPIPEELSQNGWFVGAQAYTFKEFTAFEAIAKTKEAGGNMIEFYPGQPLKPGSEEKVGHTMSPAAMAELKAECLRLGVRPVNYGVVGAGSPEDVRAIMEFAKKMELYSVCTESTEQVVAWEAAAKEFDINVAFHEHGGSMSNPKYKVWNPLYILGVVESRDHHLGACADLGHWCTSNLKPVECLRILDGRIISVHLKDKATFGNAPVVVAGTGVVDVAACLEELKRQKFNGHLSIEHEADWQDSVPQVRANIDFVKAHGK